MAWETGGERRKATGVRTQSVLAAKHSIAPQGCWVSADHSPSCLCCISPQHWTLSSREVLSQSLEKAVSHISLAQEVIWVVCCSAGQIHYTARALLSQNDGTVMCCGRINAFCAVWASARPPVSLGDRLSQGFAGPRPSLGGRAAA